MIDYEISATIIAKLFDANPSKYEEVYKTFRDKKFIPQIYGNLNSIIRMINDNCEEIEIEEKIENGHYVGTPNVNWKAKTIEKIKCYKEILRKEPSLKKLNNYKGKKLYLNFEYNQDKDDYNKIIEVHLKPSFYNRYRENNYLYYLVPSKNKWTEDNLKSLYTLLNIAMKNDEEFEKYKEVRIIHLPTKRIIKGIYTKKIFKDLKKIVKLFSIFVLDRAVKDNVDHVNALISEFNGDDDFDF